MTVPRKYVETRKNAKGLKVTLFCSGIWPDSKLRNLVKLGWKKISGRKSCLSVRCKLPQLIQTFCRRCRINTRSFSFTLCLTCSMALVRESDPCASLTSWPWILHTRTHPLIGEWCSCTVRNPGPSCWEIRDFLPAQFDRTLQLGFRPNSRKQEFLLQPLGVSPGFYGSSRDVHQKKPFVQSYLPA